MGWKKNEHITLTEVLQHDDFIFALCEFLDDFKRSKDKYSLIRDEPLKSSNNVNRCIVASAVHKLANNSNINIPEWINKPEYFSPTPIYAFGTKNKEYQKYLLENTPPEFAIRNIFHGGDAIERV